MTSRQLDDLRVFLPPPTAYYADMEAKRKSYIDRKEAYGVYSIAEKERPLAELATASDLIPVLEETAREL